MGLSSDGRIILTCLAQLVAHLGKSFLSEDELVSHSGPCVLSELGVEYLAHMEFSTVEG